MARSPYLGPLKAVILDWAGTTVDFGSIAPVIAFVEVFAHNGVQITQEQARAPMGKHKRDHIAEIAAMAPVTAAWREKHGAPPGDADIDAMFRQFVPIQMECLKKHSELIPGALAAAAEFRRRGLKIGGTTGYTAEMMAILEPEAARQGYTPDASVNASEVSAGRPAPWMCLLNMIRLGVYPAEACVKIGDTMPDIAEGLNAGMWTIGVARTGNEIGLSESDLDRLPPVELDARLERARQKLLDAGAHYAADGVGDVPPLLDEINARLSGGERP
ncbi:MAG TPA: phosphonoacetaldehyde hydrolase [Dehalococcoidia bacterium]|nr:phosphonoacetaldehyde hydrolase [Dehalococcoidia bacterium]